MAEKTIPELIKVGLDGRTQKWLSEKTGINTSELSLIMTGRLKTTQNQLDKINNILNLNLKISQ